MKNSDVDAIVLGAGISGLVSASVLLRQGAGRVLVVDEYDHLGGNHIDRAVGDYTFDVGNFVFHDDSPLLGHFPELLPRYLPIGAPVLGRLNPQGRVTRYPLSPRDDLLAAGPVEVARVVGSVVHARVFGRRITDARDFARYWIGDRLLSRAGLAAYMERFYGVPPERIDLAFAEKRMFWIKENAQLGKQIRRRLSHRLSRRPQPVRTQMVRPREGFAHLYRPARERLEAAGAQFLLGARLERLERVPGGLALSVDGRTVTAPRVVSTIPLDRAQELAGLTTAAGLRSVTLMTLFYSFAGERGFGQQVLYNFSHDGAWKRLTVHSEYYGQVDGRDYFAVEVNAGGPVDSPERADADFRRHTAANGLLRGDLRLEGSHQLASAYPIYTDQAAARAERAVADLRAFGVESLGRQGGFDYQATSRFTTLNVEDRLRADGGR